MKISPTKNIDEVEIHIIFNIKITYIKNNYNKR